MIQRVQTVYLLVAAFLLTLFFVIGDAWLVVAGEAYAWLPITASVLAALTAVVALGAVFLYKNRVMQRKVISAAQFLDLALLLVLVGTLGTLSFTTDMDLTEAGAVGFMVLLLPIFAYVALRLAQRGVKKDIDLVRSMDRLR